MAGIKILDLEKNATKTGSLLQSFHLDVETGEMLLQHIIAQEESRRLEGPAQKPNDMIVYTVESQQEHK